MAHRHRAGGSLDQRVEALRANRVSGAVDLAKEALDLAADWLAADRPPAELAAELRNMHPAIATIAGVARLLEEPAPELSARLAATRVSLADGHRLIAQQLQTVISPDSRIITLSNSSTVREALFALEPARVYVMQSLPGGEGESQAAALRAGLAHRGAKDRVKLVPDSALANLVPLVDCALVGIDSYDAGGAILHKVGTLPLALCCRHFDKPFYAVGHSLKFVAGDVRGLLQCDIEPSVQMFDCTPCTLVSRIVTESAAG